MLTTPVSLSPIDQAGLVIVTADLVGGAVQRSAPCVPSTGEILAVDPYEHTPEPGECIYRCAHDVFTDDNLGV